MFWGISGCMVCAYASNLLPCCAWLTFICSISSLSCSHCCLMIPYGHSVWLVAQMTLVSSHLIFFVFDAHADSLQPVQCCFEVNVAATSHPVISFSIAIAVVSHLTLSDHPQCHWSPCLCSSRTHQGFCAPCLSQPCWMSKSYVLLCPCACVSCLISLWCQTIFCTILIVHGSTAKIGFTSYSLVLGLTSCFTYNHINPKPTQCTPQALSLFCAPWALAAILNLPPTEYCIDMSVTLPLTINILPTNVLKLDMKGATGWSSLFASRCHDCDKLQESSPPNSGNSCPR